MAEVVELKEGGEYQVRIAFEWMPGSDQTFPCTGKGPLLCP